MSTFLLCSIVICYDSPTRCFNEELYSTVPYLSKYSDLETTVIIFDPELKCTLLKQQLLLSDSVNLATECGKCRRGENAYTIFGHLKTETIWFT
jgi:hypothetical protein